MTHTAAEAAYTSAVVVTAAAVHVLVRAAMTHTAAAAAVHMLEYRAAVTDTAAVAVHMLARSSGASHGGGGGGGAHARVQSSGD